MALDVSISGSEFYRINMYSILILCIYRMEVLLSSLLVGKDTCQLSSCYCRKMLMSASVKRYNTLCTMGQFVSAFYMHFLHI